MPDDTPVEFDPYFGGFILETLTVGMYGESRNAIREYIQNGFDAIMAARSIKLLAPNAGTIEIRMATDRKSLVIRDDGTGLGVGVATSTLTRVGASKKKHDRNAGFRGIGRLAGIVFCDRLTFVTKARNEKEQTRVVFEAKELRAAMSPGKGSDATAAQLLKRYVKAVRQPNLRAAEHFFEVRLEGLHDPPPECTSPAHMADFVSEVAPVPYPADFPYREELAQAARESGIPIEEVIVTLVDGAKPPAPITKRYGRSYTFETGATIELNACEIRRSPTDRWWAWIGKKAESGAFEDARTRGLRVRVRNIQIDGTEIMRQVFRDATQSRFQDYYVGEIFMKAAVLVPNARRDGFEEDARWRSVRLEFMPMAKDLGKEAYRVSAAGKLSVPAQQTALKKIKADYGRLKKASFTNVDKAVAVTKAITSQQRSLAKALEGADVEAAAKLTALGSEYADMKIETLRHVGNQAAEIDRERVENEARTALIAEVMELLDEQLSPDCVSEVREILADYFED